MALIFVSVNIVNAEMVDNPRMKRLSPQEISENKTPEAMAYNITKAIMDGNIDILMMASEPFNSEIWHDPEIRSELKRDLDERRHEWKFIADTPSIGSGYELAVAVYNEWWVEVADTVVEVTDVTDTVVEVTDTVAAMADTITEIVVCDGDSVAYASDEADYVPYEYGDTISQGFACVLTFSPGKEIGTTGYKNISRYHGHAFWVWLEKRDGEWVLMEINESSTIERDLELEPSTKVVVCNGEKIFHLDQECCNLEDCSNGVMLTYEMAKQQGFTIDFPACRTNEAALEAVEVVEDSEEDIPFDE